MKAGSQNILAICAGTSSNLVTTAIRRKDGQSNLGKTMADRVDAAIAALKVALKEAENSGELWWQARRANCWISQLPGAWWGRWRHLRLRSEYGATMERKLFISELRAVLAYLEAHRDEIKIARAWPWSYSGSTGAPQEPPLPTDVEFTEVKGTKAKTARKTSQPMRLVKK